MWHKKRNGKRIDLKVGVFSHTLVCADTEHNRYHAQAAKACKMFLRRRKHKGISTASTQSYVIVSLRDTVRLKRTPKIFMTHA